MYPYIMTYWLAVAAVPNVTGVGNAEYNTLDWCEKARTQLMEEIGDTGTVNSVCTERFTPNHYGSSAPNTSVKTEYSPSATMVFWVSSAKGLTTSTNFYNTVDFCEKAKLQMEQQVPSDSTFKGVCTLTTPG